MAGLPGAGTTFGRYDIVRRIGRGGMGVVYEATHRDLQRAVALKLLSMDLMDNEALRNRFIREAQALAAVDSPNIVPVFDAGEHDGWLYIATRLYPDGDLGDWIQEHGALSQDESVSVLTQVADGLADAHDAGFLHRDIKPSNILLQRRADGLRAVICDFGIAFAEGSEHTKTVGVVGTLGYMAPERHEGLPATAASDVYSLGCVLYACLQGRAPFVGTDVKVAMGHLYNPVPQVPEGPDAINDVLLRALAKNPGDRYQTAGEFRDALARLGEPEDSTVVVDFAPEKPREDPPDQTYLLPPASTPAIRPGTDDTVVPAAVDSGSGAPQVATPTDSGSAEPPDREVDVASRATVVPPRSLAPVPDAHSPTQPGWFRRRRTAVAAAAAVVLIGTLVTLPFVVGGDERGGSALADTATPTPSDAAPPSATPSTTSVRPRPPGKPVVTATRAEMGVAFRIVAESSASVGSKLYEYRREGDRSWVALPGGTVRVRAAQGGEEVCILARATVRTSGGMASSPIARGCGRSKDKTLALRLDGACTPAEAGCTSVKLVATGLRRRGQISPTTYYDGTVLPDCTFKKGPPRPCFSGRADRDGRLTAWVNWSGSEYVTVAVGDLKASIQLP